MSIKEYLLNLKEKLGFFKKEEEPKEKEISKKSYTLEELPQKKIDDFLSWYATVLPSWNEKIKVEEEIKSMQNFIEKVAVWYELRYPNFAISGKTDGLVNDWVSNLTMFEDNPYIKDLLGEDSIVNDLDWSEFYNTKAFINNLCFKEREYFVRPSYEKYILINGYHLELSKNGRVLSFAGLKQYGLKSKEVNGKDVKEVVTLLKEKEIIPPTGSEIDKEIQIYEEKKERKEKMLDAIMCRIIERGDNYAIGARRGLLFAIEFKQSTLLPLTFETTLGYDPYIDVFLREANKYEETKEPLKFLVPLFNPKYSEKDIDEMLKTKEEKEQEKQLRQRLVNILATKAGNDETKEDVKVLRIQRKLNKSRNSR
jgi:hypothetical protein